MIDEAEILEAVRKRNSPESEVRISRTIPGFLNGELIVVDVYRNDQKIGENFYYSAHYPEDRRSFTSMDELALWMGQHELSSRRSGPLSVLSDFRIVSGLIAILITLTIITLIIVAVIRGWAIEVPDILSNALTIILGFYFGSQVAKTKGADEKKIV